MSNSKSQESKSERPEQEQHFLSGQVSNRLGEPCLLVAKTLVESVQRDTFILVHALAVQVPLPRNSAES